MCGMETTAVFKGTHHSCSSNLVHAASIDLNNANDDIDTRKCEHFSICGYASEMRKKDWKKSWPFALDGDRNIFKEQICKLPPLLVPKFRWWSCQNCLQETGAEGSINEDRTNNSSKLKSFGSCSHVPSSGDAVKCSSDLQQTGMVYVDSRKSGAVACVNVNSSARHPLVSGKTEKKPENADMPVIVASLQLRNPDLKGNEVAGVNLPESNVECTVKNATETRQTGKSALDQQMGLVNGSGSHGIASAVHRVPNAVMTNTDGHPPVELDDCDYASSESDEVLPGTVSGSLHRRKNRKVRPLTELLGKKEDEKNNLTSTKDSPSGTIRDASIGIDSISTSQGQVNSQGNVTSSLARRKKRKMPQDEEWVPGEFMCFPNNGRKNLKTFTRDAESADRITSSDSEGTSNRSSSQTPAKSNLANAKEDKSPILGKKKSKNTQNFDECSSPRLSRENLQKERQKKPPGDTTKSDAANIVLYKSNDVSTGSGLNTFPESASEAEKNSNLLKKKREMHPDHDCQASRVPWNNGNLREGLISRKDVKIRQTGNIAVPPEVIHDTSAKKGLQFSLSNNLSAKRYDAKYSTPIRDERGHVLSEFDTGMKDLNMNYVSQADAYVWKGMHADLNSNQTTHKTPFLNEKQDRSPVEVENSSIQLMAWAFHLLLK